MNRTLAAYLMIGALFALVAGRAGAEPAEPDCTLKKFASYDLLTETDGRVAIPMILNGQKVSLMVDTGGVFSVLAFSTANALQLKPRPLPNGLYFEFYGKDRLTTMVDVDSLAIGQASIPNWQFIVGPDSLFTGDDGLIGANFLKGFDVDIDYAHSKLNLISPDHCPGRVIYWTKEPDAEVQMDLDDNWHITIPVVLDGKSVTATVDTGAAQSSMTLEEAKRLFDLSDADPRLKPMGAEDSKSQDYRYPFASMTFDGVSVQNPDIVLIPEAKVAKGAPPLLLGATVLRQLHVYIAYHVKKLHLTGAEAK
jgi:predicted aspartyl protease